MADRWLFAGGGLETLRTAAGTLTVTTSAFRNTTYTDHAVGVSNGARAMADFVDASGASDAAVTGEKVNLHFVIRPPANNNAVASIAELVDDLDQPWLAIRATGSGEVYGLYYNSGTGASPVWTAVPDAGTVAAAGTGVHTFDKWLTLGSPHVAGWALADSLIGQGSFTQASLTRVDAGHLRNVSSGVAWVSEISATVGINLVGSHVLYGRATGAGSNSGFTGTFADIDDAGITDTDALSSGTAGQRSTFAYSNLPTLGANEAVGDVFLWTRARNSGGAPSNIAPVRRTSGGTDNVGSNFSGISGAYQNFLTRYSGLTESEYNGSEFGVESAT